MVTRRRLIVAAASAPVVLAGCKVRTINYFPPTPADVRFVNLTVDSPGIDVRVGGSTLWSGVAFEQVTPYAGLDNEQTTFQLFATVLGQEVANVTISLAGEQAYTLLSYGTVALTFALVAPDTSSNAGDGNFLFRVINVAASLPAFDIYIADPAIPVDDNLSPNFSNLQSGSSTIALRLSIGTYSVRLAVAGTKSVVYDSGPQVFGGNLSTDFVAYTLGTASLPQGMQLDVNEGGTQAVLPNRVASARIVNGAVQTGAIDVSIADTSVASALAYATSTTYEFITAGSSLVTAQATSTPGAAIATLQAEFGSARESTLVVLGLPGATRILAFLDDNRLPVAGAASVRFVNASSDTAAYDVFVGDTKLVSALVAGAASLYLPIVAGTNTVTFRDPGTGAVALTIADLAFGDGNVKSIFAVGTAGALASIVNSDR